MILPKFLPLFLLLPLLMLVMPQYCCHCCSWLLMSSPLPSPLSLVDCCFFGLIFWVAILPWLFCCWCCYCYFANDDATVFAGAVTCLLHAPPWYHYCCCFLSLPLPVLLVDCCFCLLWLSLFKKMTLLLWLLPVMLPLYCLAVTTSSTCCSVADTAALVLGIISTLLLAASWLLLLSCSHSPLPMLQPPLSFALAIFAAYCSGL